jgi:hypothetical protein
MEQDAIKAHLALSAGDTSIHLMTTALKSVCSALARLTGESLRGCDGWNRFYWVDDIISTDVTVASHDEMMVRGVMVWANGGNNPFWIEPIEAWVRLISHEGGKCSRGKVWRLASRSGQHTVYAPDKIGYASGMAIRVSFG